MNNTKIFLAFSQKLILSGIKGLLEEERQFNVAGAITDKDNLRVLVEEHVPDILVLDLSVTFEDLVKIILSIKYQNPNVKILVLTKSLSIPGVDYLQTCGVSAIVSKCSGADALKKILTEVKFSNNDIIHLSEYKWNICLN